MLEVLNPPFPRNDRSPIQRTILCFLFQLCPSSTQGNQCSLCAAVDVQFAIDFTEPVGNRAFGEIQSFGNGLIICALGHQTQNLHFPVTQLFLRASRACLRA